MGFFPFLKHVKTYYMLKRIFLVIMVCALFVTGIFVFVLYKMSDHNGISIRINESDNTYQFYASYGKNKTRQLQKYLDGQLNTNKMLEDSKMDSYITLKDNTVLYIKTTPGKLLIKLDKNENTDASYARIKRIGEQVKMNLATDE